MRNIDILIIEDNAADAELTIRALKKNNLTNSLLHVTDGAEALNFLFAEGNYAGRPIGEQPYLILLDIKMPKVSGLEVLEKIKADERTKNIPVVMLTSSKEETDIEKCYQLGVNSYIVKPVEFELFVKAVSGVGLYWMILNQPVKRF